jgi:hypothetical protein
MAIDAATLLFVSKQDFQALCLTHPLQENPARSSASDYYLAVRTARL